MLRKSFAMYCSLFFAFTLTAIANRATRIIVNLAFALHSSSVSVEAMTTGMLAAGDRCRSQSRDMGWGRIEIIAGSNSGLIVFC
jgi:hypothetical protein